MKIEAALFDAGAGPRLVVADLAAPGPHQIRVKLVATGICHTDVKASLSCGPVPHPVVLGHEGAGHVDAVGADVTNLQPGDPVVLTFAACGACPACDAGEPAYCHHSVVLNFGCEGPTMIHVGGAPVHSGFFGQSSFATYAIVDAKSAVRVRVDAPLSLMAPLGCGVQTGAGAVLNVLKPHPGATLAVFGAGSVGLSAIMAAKLTPACRIVAVDRNEARLGTARALGATHLLVAGANLEERLQVLLGGGVDIGLDTTGVPEVIYAGMKALNPRGTLGYVTSPWDGRDLAMPGRHMLWGRKIVGIIQGSSRPQSFIPALVDLVMSGAFDLRQIITEYPFEKIAEAFADMKSGKTIKPVLRFDP